MFKFCLRRSRRYLLVASVVCGTAAAPAKGDGLGEALQATLRNHPAVAGQQASVLARRHAADEARSQRYPTLSAQAQQYTNGGRSSITGEKISHPAILRLRQPIWSFGRIGNSIALANAEVDTEQADLLRVRRQLLEETAVAYTVVRGSLELVEVARRNVAEHEELLTQIDRRVTGQLASSADSRLAATRLAQAQAILAHAVSEWEVSREDLSLLTQETTGANEPVPAELLEVSGPVQLIEQAMTQSAAVRVKQQQLGQAEVQVDEARTSLMPTIYLQADRLYDQPGLRDDNQFSVVFEASLDGLGFAARGRTRSAAASQAAAKQDLAAAKLALRRDLERLQRSRRLQSDLIALQTQALGDLEALLASYQRQYETGTKSWLDLMNVQRERFEQQRQLVQAQNDWVIYSLMLQSKTGGLDRLAALSEHTDG
jgi:adhesin transport system outer membrane protein